MSDSNSDPDYTGGPSVSGSAVSDTQTAYGGGGGGGGDGADLFGNGASGAGGNPVDGADGEDDVGQGGEGGGGQGGAAEEEGDPGGDGGYGGDGDNAWGRVISLQKSTVDAVAELEFGPSADENTPEETIARAVVNISWGRTGYEMGNEGSLQDGDVWQRGVAIDITFGDAWLTLDGDPQGPLTAYGQTSEDQFYKESEDNLNDASGSLSISGSEFWDYISVGGSATINAGENSHWSSLVGEMTRNGGEFGEGGCEEGGYDGSDSYPGGGAADGIDGGDGGDGGKVIAHEAGIFQGVVAISVDN